MRILGWIATAIVGFGFASASAGARDATGTGPAPLGGAAVLDEWVVQIEKLVVPAAEAMPEDRYSFAPTVGEFAGVRTFAEQVKHLAAANWQLGSRVLGENPPPGHRTRRLPRRSGRKPRSWSTCTDPSRACTAQPPRAAARD